MRSRATKMELILLYFLSYYFQVILIQRILRTSSPPRHIEGSERPGHEDQSEPPPPDHPSRGQRVQLSPAGLGDYIKDLVAQEYLDFICLELPLRHLYHLIMSEDLFRVLRCIGDPPPSMQRWLRLRFGEYAVKCYRGLTNPEKEALRRYLIYGEWNVCCHVLSLYLELIAFPETRTQGWVEIQADPMAVNLGLEAIGRIVDGCPGSYRCLMIHSGIPRLLDTFKNWDHHPEP